MSSINRGILLLYKRLEVALSFNRPDCFIFQSEGMRQSATKGRGIPKNQTRVVRTGIDTDLFCPSAKPDWYAHDTFKIERNRKIVFFSGHMEARKGVDVIIKTAVHLVNNKHSNVHFVLLGNQNGEESAFFPLFMGTPAEQHITFGGYRNDIPQLLKSCAIGFIASTGWDSFPMSSIEMAATELPLVVSDLPGLREAVTEETGFLYPVGDFVKAAEHIQYLLENEPVRQQLGRKGRLRAIEKFSVYQQVSGLEKIIREISRDIL